MITKPNKTFKNLNFPKKTVKNFNLTGRKNNYKL